MRTIDGCGPQKTKPVFKLSEPDRRAFLAGAISLPLATVLAVPELARAQGARLTEVDLPTQSGDTARGMIAMPAKQSAPAVLLVHEWWGLNDQIKAVAAELADPGFIVLAVDLFDGKAATTASGAGT